MGKNRLMLVQDGLDISIRLQRLWEMKIIQVLVYNFLVLMVQDAIYILGDSNSKKATRPLTGRQRLKMLRLMLKLKLMRQSKRQKTTRLTTLLMLHPTAKTLRRFKPRSINRLPRGLKIVSQR